MVNISQTMGYEIRGNRLGDDAEWSIKQRGAAAGRQNASIITKPYIAYMKLSSGEGGHDLHCSPNADICRRSLTEAGSTHRTRLTGRTQFKTTSEVFLSLSSCFPSGLFSCFLKIPSLELDQTAVVPEDGCSLILGIYIQCRLKNRKLTL